MLFSLLLASGLLTTPVRPVLFPVPPLTRKHGAQAARARTASLSFPPDDRDAPGFSSVAEAQMVGLINEARAANGLPRLVCDSDLTVAARSHCRDMSDSGYFDHDSPLRGQHTPLDRYLFTLARMGERPPNSLTVGENILNRSDDGPDESARDNRTLMNSPGHRANILNPRFTKFGVGVFRDADGEVWVTEMFLRDKP